MKEPFIQTKPKSKWFMVYERYMLIMGTAGQLLFYIQALKIFRNCSAKDVSIEGFALALIAVTSWTIYGILIKNKVIIISNGFALIGAIFTLIGILKYG